MLQIEFEFTLPCGYIDEQGNLHRQGIMRRATARDEVELYQHPRARANEVYFGVLLLSRVLLRLGTIKEPGPDIVEGLFSTDFLFLQELYERINGGSSLVETQCPVCGSRFMLDMNQNES